MTDELPGMTAGTPKRRPRTWAVEIAPVGQTLAPAKPTSVRVTLIDQETGRRIGAKNCPWEWFRDCATGTVLVQIDEGVWS